MKRRNNFRSLVRLINFVFLSLALLAFAGRIDAQNFRRAGLERQKAQINEGNLIPAKFILTVQPATPGSIARYLARTFSEKVIVWFGVIFGVFIIAQTVFNLWRSSRDQRAYYVWKGLAILGGWILLSFGLIIFLNVTNSSIRRGIPDQTETTNILMAGFWIVGTVIHVLIGIGLGFLAKGGIKWRIPVIIYNSHRLFRVFDMPLLTRNYQSGFGNVP